MGAKSVSIEDKQIGKRIKESAKKLGYTATTLAEKMNLEEHTVYRMYRGESLNYVYIKEISKILNVSTDYLLNGEEEKEEKIITREDKLAFFIQLDDYDLDKVYNISKLILDIAY